ncbi:unnamed protein product [Gulo gulo]|uniref:Uncharacterized protein n=1 Tax=Gulo gulo TaxID=48420 RepID=A0A9X9QAP2_GULGU|nr:unnamed protein product [Gulo gulo]
MKVTSSSRNLGISNTTWLITSLVGSVFSYSFWEEVEKSSSHCTWLI